jgi:putative DNA primase/helicase
MAYRFDVEAPVNGRVRRATVTVLDEAGTVVTTDKADLDDLRQLDALGGRLGERLQVQPAKIVEAVGKRWAEVKTERRRQDSGPRPAAPAGGEIHLTDLGNARLLVRWHGHLFRHVHPWKKDLAWDGQRWLEDNTAEVERLAKKTVGRLFAEAAADSDERRRAALVEHALLSEDVRRLKAMMVLARSEPAIPALPADLDRDRFLLNVSNGTVDLKSGQLRPHRREDLITKLAPVEYDPDAKYPLWEQFALWAMSGKVAMLRYLQRVAGYCLTGSVDEQCLWFLYGCGANGKTTFVRTLLGMLGGYAWQAVPELLLQRQHDAHPTERADLFGRRLVATIEIDEGKRVAEALLKLLTGGDEITARRLYQDFFKFDPTHKLFLVANHKPVIRGTDHAVWRRIKMVPFDAVIQDSAKDPQLLDKLKAEWPGVLRWAVEGCLEWQRDGLDEPQEVTDATATYRAEQDQLGGFLAEVCVVLAEAKVQTSVLYQRYQEWSGDKDMTQKAFTRAMEVRGYPSVPGHGNRRFYRGVGLPGGGVTVRG